MLHVLIEQRAVPWVCILWNRRNRGGDGRKTTQGRSDPPALPITIPPFSSSQFSSSHTGIASVASSLLRVPVRGHAIMAAAVAPAVASPADPQSTAAHLATTCSSPAALAALAATALATAPIAATTIISPLAAHPIAAAAFAAFAAALAAFLPRLVGAVSSEWLWHGAVLEARQE